MKFSTRTEFPSATRELRRWYSFVDMSEAEFALVVACFTHALKTIREPNYVGPPIPNYPGDLKGLGVAGPVARDVDMIERLLLQSGIS